MKSACLLLLTLATSFTIHASVDFTPTTGERVLDGIKFQQLIFRDGDRKITYEQPRGWTYSGDSNRIVLTPPQISQAQAYIDQSPLTAPSSFDETAVKILQEKAVKSLPPSAKNVEFVTIEKNPVVLNQHETLEIIMSYEASGTAFSSSVLFVNLPDIQLRFGVMSRKADFEKIHTAFRRSIFSWQWM
jgi:hypothetical protein